MFTRRKKNYRTFVVAALIVTLCLLFVVLLWPKDNSGNGDLKVNAQTDSPNTSQGTEGNEGDNANSSNGTGQDGSQATDGQDQNSDSENPDTDNQGQSYYLVKKEGSGIWVFFSDSQGNLVKLEETDILYDLLPPEDQKSFDKGVVASSQDQLAALLQDFGS